MPWPLQTFLAPRPSIAPHQGRILHEANDMHQSDHDRLRHAASTSTRANFDASQSRAATTDLSHERQEQKYTRNNKRRSLIGSTIALGLESAAFSMAVAQAAYQMFTDQPNVSVGGDDDVDRHVARTKELKAQQAIAAASLIVPDHPPPPYTEIKETVPPESAVAAARARKHAKRRSLTVYTSSSPYREPLPESDPFAHLKLPSRVAKFQAFEEIDETRDVVNDDDDDEDSKRQDAEMDAMAERIKSLIESGTKALHSRPVLSSPVATPPVSPNKRSTTVAGTRTSKASLNRRHSTHLGIRTPGTPKRALRPQEDEELFDVRMTSPSKPSKHDHRASMDSSRLSRNNEGPSPFKAR
ncbi:hypothetical protein OIO90_000747 [Microbotryomycetes sp. JL221]|nr:hypothetical protein OIO90_000747 [Microbotryomycetes sp. JL221]